MTEREKITAAFKITLAVAETIRDFGEVPEGPMYAGLMGIMDLAGFESMVRVLVNQGLVAREGNMLRWTGPAGGAE